MILYHGSNIQNLKFLSSNFNISKHIKTDENFVYLTPDKAFAACYGAPWDDKIARQGYFDDILTFGVSDKIYKLMCLPCSIYELNINIDDCICVNEYEYTVKNNISVTVIREEKYLSFSAMLKDNNVNVITYKEFMNKLSKRRFLN